MNNNLASLRRRLFSVATAVCLLIPANTAFAQTGITLKMSNAQVEKVLDAIEGQSKYLFLNDQVDLSRTISIDVEGASIEKTLEKMFEGTGISYRIEGTNIYITSKDSSGSQDVIPGTIKGQVVDQAGIPVIGAVVVVKGTTNGVSTDLDGYFTLEVSDPDAVLEVSFLGYQTQEIPVGGKAYFDIVLMEDSFQLEQVVVTALGIKRSEKALSYSVQQINSEELLANKDANFINSLNGKVPGLVINSSSSGVGGASKVTMRGQKSIMQSSNALYVIDGVPMFTTAREGGTEFSSTGSTDPIADINPEDIESLSVLNGAAAAALYGSDGANGAIVITTKKGSVGKTRISVSSNTEVSTPFVLPQFQNRYGTGDLNSPEGSSSRSWGYKLNDSNYMGYDPRRDYFQTGVTATENVSFSTGNEKNQTYASVAAVNSRGIVPNNNYERYNFNFRNTTSFLNDKMTLDVNASYILQKDRNMTNQGTYNNPIVGAYLFPRGDDWNDIVMYERYDSTRKLFTQYWPAGNAGMAMQNPYWINYRNLRENDKDRYMLGASLSYKILDWLTLSGRVRMDNSSNRYTEKFYASTNTQLTEGSDRGLYGLTETKTKQIYADALMSINKSFGDDWSLQANIGASISDMRSDATILRGPIADGKVPGEKPGLANVFNLMNLSTSRLSSVQEGWREQTQSVFASAEISYKGAYYLTLTGRNDWPSQLAGPNSSSHSFFYPSIGASVVLSEIIDMPEMLEYVKIRSSFASVGVAFERYIANPMYSWDNSTKSWSNKTSYPMYNLKPEKTNSIEVGISTRFLKYFSMDLTYYNTQTKNQTFDPKISAGSGWSNFYVQSGNVLNEGVELSLGFKNTWGKFSWSSNYTMSSNRNEILELADNVTNPITGEKFSISSLNMGGLGQTRFLLTEGGTLGDLYSFIDLKRDSNGDIYVDQNGNISTETVTDASKAIKLGSVLPKANMAWRNDFKFGNFNLGFTISARIGGVVFSRTQAILDDFGVSEASAAARDNGGVVINGGDLIDANKWYSAVGGGTGVAQFYTYSATNVRLQELSFGYTIPREKLGNVCDLTLQLVGKNLLMIYNKAPFDPEATASLNNYYQGIDYFMMPSTRNVGFNIRLNF